MSASALAEPPFITDDADPASIGLAENYLFVSFATLAGNSFILGPAYEIDYGFIKDTELHITTAMATSIPQKKETTFGYGDLNVNIKHRFVHERQYIPEMVIVPAIFFATGNANRGLGNGKTWYALPIWLQKNGETWKLYAGGGYAYNWAKNKNNYFYGGIAFEKKLTDHLTLGWEIFSQGSPGKIIMDFDFSKDIGPSALFDMGFVYKLLKHLDAIGAIGHTFVGKPQWYGYCGVHFSFERT